VLFVNILTEANEVVVLDEDNDLILKKEDRAKEGTKDALSQFRTATEGLVHKIGVVRHLNNGNARDGETEQGNSTTKEHLTNMYMSNMDKFDLVAARATAYDFHHVASIPTLLDVDSKDPKFGLMTMDATSLIITLPSRLKKSGSGSLHSTVTPSKCLLSDRVCVG
jgi:hypothetical protein